MFPWEKDDFSDKPGGKRTEFNIFKNTFSTYNRAHMLLLKGIRIQAKRAIAHIDKLFRFIEQHFSEKDKQHLRRKRIIVQEKVSESDRNL